MAKITAYKHRLILIIKILFLICLLIFPIRLAAVDDNQILQLENALIQSPNDQTIIINLANSYNNKAVELANQQQWSAAEEYLKKAKALMPQAVNFNINLSSVYLGHALALYNDKSRQNYSSDNHADAKQLVMQALALNPSSVNAYILLGDIEYMNQHMFEAKEAWQQAANLMPNNQSIQDRLAKISRETQTEIAMSNKYDLFFNIKIDKEIANLPGFDISQALNSARVKVSQDFSYVQPNKIPVVVYTMQQYKDTLIDAPQWSEGAYDGKLRVILSPTQKDFRQTKSNIVHEYTHAVVGDISRNKCPRWFNEGLAKYEEYKHGVRPSISVLAIAYNANSLLAWDQINEVFLNSSKNQVLLAYEQSFSFIYFIVQRYGMYKVVALLKVLATNPDFPAAVMKVYNIPLENLQSSWRKWLTTFITNWAEGPVSKSYQ